ncbi:MAG: hypothetical protein ACREB6_13530 [Rhodospirillales bacterium]
MSVKISVNLPDAAAAALRDISAKKGITMTEVLRRAISTEKFLTDAVENDSKILIEDKDKSIKQLLVT